MKFMQFQNLMSVIKKILQLRFEISFQLLVSTIYIVLMFLYSNISDEFYMQWMSFNGPILYPFIPKILFNFNFYFLMKIIFFICCSLCCFGIKIRLTSILCFLTGFIYLLLLHAGGASTHQHNLPILCLLILALHFNLNDIVTQKRLVFLIRLSFCLVFFTSGLSKLRYLNTAWFEPEIHLTFLLKNRFLFGFYQKDILVDFNRLFVQYIDWTKWLFYISLPLELMMPLALMRKFRFLIWPIAIMQFFISKTIFALFSVYIPLYLVWFKIRYTKSDLVLAVKS